MSILRITLIGSLATIAVLLGSSAVIAGCGCCCKGSHGGSHHGHANHGQYQQPGFSSYGYGLHTARPAFGPAAVYAPPLRPVPPPPGTLGRTYLRPSRAIPKDKHSRIAILEVRAPADANVTVEGRADFDSFVNDEGNWVFETTRPLLPGIAHVYTVRAKFLRDGRPVTETRKVRLIPGRIVDLPF